MHCWLGVLLFVHFKREGFGVVAADVVHQIHIDLDLVLVEQLFPFLLQFCGKIQPVWLLRIRIAKFRDLLHIRTKLILNHLDLHLIQLILNLGVESRGLPFFKVLEHFVELVPSVDVGVLLKNSNVTSKYEIEVIDWIHVVPKHLTLLELLVRE